ncbi:trigger factor [Scatolibacter rhodanostii]|uniref:trigger factor n=1 Tax=Scatolibacter rhodanostii TaxID=2014781 RepID=UPI000C06FE4D|nr:trigger factor [Scatolibacter rhodanostii]
MNLTAKNSTETNKFELDFSVSAEKFNEAIQQVYKVEGKKIAIDGFRKGKAPLAFIEKYYGENVFFEGAIDKLYRDIVTTAIEQSELDVVAVSAFNIEEMSKKDGVKCKLTVVIKPEIEIKDYKGIEVTKDTVSVTEKEVDAEVEKIRERNARTIEVTDRATKDGDIAVIDFEGFLEDKPFDGGKGENHELTLGSGQFIPGFEEQVVGHVIGDEFDVNVSFPEDYQAEDLKGKAVVFKVKLHEIKAKELPEVDDEFVKDVSEFDTVKDYRADLKAHLKEHKQEHADSDAENQLVDAIIAKVKGEIPDEMYENEVDEIINSFAYRLQSQGLNMETYMQYTGMTMEEMRKTYRAQAENQVKIRLALEKIASIEGITASDEEIEKEFAELAKNYNMEAAQVKGMIRPEDLAKDVVNKKTIDFVKENADIKTAKKTSKKEKAKEE